MKILTKRVVSLMLGLVMLVGILQYAGIPVSVYASEDEHEHNHEETVYSDYLTDEDISDTSEVEYIVESVYEEEASEELTDDEYVNYDDEIMTMAICFHKWVLSYTSGTGCYSDVVEHYYCSKCSNTKTKTITKAANSHDYSTTVVTKEPTCESSGTRKSYCSRCSATKTETLAKTGHSYRSTGVQQATCTSPALVTMTCSGCGHSYVASSGSPKGHSAGDWQTITISRCNQEGKQVKYCSRCGTQVDSRSTGYGSHSYGSWYTTSSGDCKTQGTKERTCSICGNTETSTNGYGSHSYGSWYINSYASTCDEYDEYKRDCSLCGKSEYRSGDKGPHVYLEWRVTSSGNCKRAETLRGECEECGHVETKTGNYGSHSFSEWSVSYSGNCKEYSEETRTCSICGKEETRTGAIGNHEYSDTWVTKEPGCGESGYGYGKCCYCGDINLSMSVDIPPIGEHILKEEVTRKPVCGIDGRKRVTCTRPGCNYDVYYSIEAPEGPCDFSKEIARTAATCTEDEKIKTECTKCGQIQISYGTPALGHDYILHCHVDSDYCDVDSIENDDGIATCDITFFVPFTEWSPDYCSYYECSRRGCRNVTNASHEWGNDVVKIEKNDATTHNEYYRCAKCHHNWPKNGPSSHTYAATDISKSYHKWICVCGQEHSRGEEPHKMIDNFYSNTGKSKRECELCYREDHIHKFDLENGDYTVETPSTCKKHGVGEATCTECGDLVKCALPFEHEWIDYLDETRERTVKQCSLCEKKDHVHERNYKIEPEVIYSGTCMIRKQGFCICAKCGEKYLGFLEYNNEEHDSLIVDENGNQLYCVDPGDNVHHRLACKCGDGPFEEHDYQWVKYDEETYPCDWIKRCICGHVERDEEGEIVTGNTHDYATEEYDEERQMLTSICSKCGDIADIADYSLDNGPIDKFPINSIVNESTIGIFKYDVDNEIIARNLEKNRVLDKSIYGYIHGQMSGAHKDMLMSKDTYIGKCGCELIAVYNTLNYYETESLALSNIIEKAESNGYILRVREASDTFGKEWGTNPHKLGELITKIDSSLKVTKHTELSSLSDINTDSEKEGIYIVSFWNDSTPFDGIHTVMIQKRKGKTGLYVYNYYSRDVEERYFDTLKNMINQYNPNTRMFECKGTFICAYEIEMNTEIIE